MSTAKTVKVKKAPDPEQNARAVRETIESIIIAIILAFLFRSFEAEAFVIPTGSMAPTLQGRHKDVECPKCGHRYRTGASDRPGPQKQEVVGTVCPICRYSQTIDPIRDPNEDAFTGDRILVSKFAYQIGEPDRWDPIVFKFPGNPKINYIKRLVGLPEETIRIFHGDIFVTGPGNGGEHIARKPPRKLLAMLQLVDDSSHWPDELTAVNWPSKWQPWSGETNPAKWTADGRTYSTDGQGGVSWLRYYHIVPDQSDWDAIRNNQRPPGLERRGELISDFYTYNECYTVSAYEFEKNKRLPAERYEEFVRTSASSISPMNEVLGDHWVGDLAMEALVEVTSNSGELLLDLTEGGEHFYCRIDVATGLAQLDIDDGKAEFTAAAGGKPNLRPQAQTIVRGPGKYRVRMSNCDDELLLWINDSIVAFNSPTTYSNRPNCAPQWSQVDPGDLAPVGIGTKGASFTVSNLRILRDVYYVSRELVRDPATISTTFRNPNTWATTDLFSSREGLEFRMDKDQFFPLGDNSPQSEDARMWHALDENGNRAHYVERKFLIGKALLIYWPHAWNRPVPFTPNVQRMGIIR